MKHRTHGVLTLVVTAGLVAVAACSPPPPASGGGDSTGAATGGSSGSGGVSTRPVTVWMQQKPDHMSPFLPATYGNGMILSATQDLLAVATSDGTIVPRLASKWAISDDAKTITLDLVTQKWSDGQDFTPDDVIFTLSRFADKNVKATLGTRLAPVVGYDELNSGAAKTLSGVTATGPHQVTIQLKEANSAFLFTLLSTLYFIVPKHVLESIAPADLAGNDLWKKPTVGLGPFTLVQNLPDQRAELKRNPNFRTPVKFETLIESAVAQDVATSQLASGEMDLSLVAPADIKTVQGMSNVTVTQYNSPGFDRYTINLSKDYFKDKRIRQAILYAIDRDGIVASVYGGAAVPVSTSFLAKLADTSSLNQYKYDPAKAKQLLTEAGWDFSRQIDLVQANNNAFRATINEVVAKNLNDAGMKVTIKPIDQAQVNDTLKGGGYDLFLYGGGNYVADPSQDAPILLCNQNFQQGLGANLPGYCNPQVDQAFTDAAATGDAAKRGAAFTTAAKLENDDVSHIWVARPKVVYASGSNLSGVKGSEAMSDALLFASDWVVK